MRDRERRLHKVAARLTVPQRVAALLAADPDIAAAARRHRARAHAGHTGRVPPRRRADRSAPRHHPRRPGPGRVPDHPARGARGAAPHDGAVRPPGGGPGVPPRALFSPARPGRSGRPVPRHGGAPGRAPAPARGGGRARRRRRRSGVAAGGPAPHRRPPCAPSAAGAGDRGRRVRRGSSTPIPSLPTSAPRRTAAGWTSRSSSMGSAGTR